MAAVTAGVLAGCGGEETAGDSEKADRADHTAYAEARAREVADAWQKSKAADVWNRGYYPMADLTEAPERGFRNKADEHAFATGNFELRGDLSDGSQKSGKVTWRTGASLELPLMEPRKAYEALDRSEAEGTSLIVTGVRLGAMVHQTSRGPATVPAWLFTVDGYEAPLKRVAVSPSALPTPPIRPARDVSGSELTPLNGIAEVAQDGRSLTVLASHGACDDGPAVRTLETRTTVVLSASVLGAEDGPCSGESNVTSVNVKLDRSVYGRIVLDAFTGRPVQYAPRVVGRS
ncbi:hypothetical protein L1I79_11880 [Strepomyces sp. STD 3.1]|nr:hypothetical protein [Streptomyces sp. STD 3.1]